MKSYKLTIPVLHKELGFYEPAFFLMHLETEFPKGFLPLQKMDEGQLSTFVHEYIHFLQDFTSYAGLNNAYVYTEYIKACLKKIKANPAGNFKIPVKLGGNVWNVELNQFVNQECVGKEWIEKDTVFPRRVVEKDVKLPYRSFITGLKEYYIETLQHELLPFNTIAIRENMAYIIERQITRVPKGAKDYPYLSAEIVLRLEYPELANDQLIILALCDVSMLFSNPGGVFIKIVRDMKRLQIMPTQPEMVYDFAYNNLMCAQMSESTTVPVAFAKMAIFTGNCLQDYFYVSKFPYYINTIRNFIGYGLHIRLNHKTFFIDLVRNGYARSNNLLQQTINRLGTPTIIDVKNNYCMMPAITGENRGIYMFSAIHEMYKCFHDGHTLCEMIEWCEQNENATLSDYEKSLQLEGMREFTKVDERCYDCPWEKSDGKSNLCPYAALWHNWGLDGYTPLTT